MHLPSDRPSPPAHHQGHWTRAVLERAKKYIVLCAGILLLILVLAFELHLVHAPELVQHGPFLAVIFLIGLLHLLTDIQHTLDKTRAEVLELGRTRVTQLHTLEECVYELAQQVEKVDRSETLVLRIIGLDLAQSWSKVERVLRKRDNVVRAECEILMLGDAEAESDLPASLKKWMNHSRESIGEIEEGLARMVHPAAGIRREIKLTVKTYASIPLIHGIQVITPAAVAAHYICLCRWEPNGAFSWGDGSYLKATAAEAEADPLKADLCEVFNGHFTHLWQSGADALTLPRAAQQS